MKKKVILDCDPGMDDSMAIVMACKSEVLDVLAVTTVNGNYPVDVTAENALKVLEMIGRTDIPVAKGMAQPMVRDVPKDPFSHGADGQAENYLPTPKAKLSPLHAVDMIIETVKAYAGEVTLIMTGPMTNLGMAIRKEPAIIPMIREIIAISGAFGLNQYAYLNATGDTPQSEWNVYVDPEAARLVYHSGIPLTALGLDVATHFETNLSEDDLRELKESQRKEAGFLYNAVTFVTGRGYQAYCTVIDCMAVGYAIDPTIVKTIEGRVGIETDGVLSLGNTVLERRHHHTWNDLPLIKIGESADYERFLKMVKELVLA